MKRSSIWFLRLAVLGIGLVMAALCLIALPAGIASDEADYYKPLLLGLYIPAIPFFYALYHTMKLLRFIDRNVAFSDLSVNALKRIKLCGALVALLFAAGSPYIYHVAQKDDAPGVMLLGLIIVFASAVISVFAAVLEKLLQSAIAIKSENDLTV